MSDDASAALARKLQAEEYRARDGASSAPAPRRSRRTGRRAVGFGGAGGLGWGGEAPMLDGPRRPVTHRKIVHRDFFDAFPDDLIDSD
jgi:hypothetical protein